MGICIHLAISSSVTDKEWAAVYQETLQLIKVFPLADTQEIVIRGIPTICFTRTEEREYRYGRYKENSKTGWFAEGDYECLRRAENYYLPRDLVSEDHYEEDDADAILCMVPQCLRAYHWDDPRFNHSHDLWGAKTQGEPYHIYLLSVACLIVSRLGRKAYVYGDITKGQCERAVRMANEHLEQKIQTPDQCDQDRLLSRIDGLSLSETEKLGLFTGLYLGHKYAEFGKTIREHYSKQACEEYWRGEFEEYRITQPGFERAFDEYLLWGFDLGEMCSYVVFQDADGKEHYDEFIRKVMDAKLHIQDKDCKDPLKINPDEEQPYSVGTQFAQLVFYSARNRKIDRFIPVEEIKSTLIHAIGGHCPVNDLIDQYLKEEREQESANLSNEASEGEFQNTVKQDPFRAFAQFMESERTAYEKVRRKYAISEPEDLLYYETGDTLSPDLMEAVGRSLAVYRSALAEDTYQELMNKEPEERCRWLSETNRYVLLRDKDWETIYEDITSHTESFARYYPMVRVNITSEGIHSMVRAFVVNAALYSYAFELEKMFEADH